MKRASVTEITEIDPKRPRVDSGDSGDSGAWSADSDPDLELRDIELEGLACRVAESVLSPVPMPIRPGTPMVAGDGSPPGGARKVDKVAVSGSTGGTVLGGRPVLAPSWQLADLQRWIARPFLRPPPPVVADLSRPPPSWVPCFANPPPVLMPPPPPPASTPKVPPLVLMPPPPPPASTPKGPSLAWRTAFLPPAKAPVNLLPVLPTGTATIPPMVGASGASLALMGDREDPGAAGVGAGAVPVAVVKPEVPGGPDSARIVTGGVTGSPVAVVKPEPVTEVAEFGAGAGTVVPLGEAAGSVTGRPIAVVKPVPLVEVSVGAEVAVIKPEPVSEASGDPVGVGAGAMEVPEPILEAPRVPRGSGGPEVGGRPGAPLGLVPNVDSVNMGKLRVGSVLFSTGGLVCTAGVATWSVVAEGTEFTLSGSPEEWAPVLSLPRLTPDQFLKHEQVLIKRCQMVKRISVEKFAYFEKESEKLLESRMNSIGVGVYLNLLGQRNFSCHLGSRNFRAIPPSAAVGILGFLKKFGKCGVTLDSVRLCFTELEKSILHNPAFLVHPSWGSIIRLGEPGHLLVYYEQQRTLGGRPVLVFGLFGEKMDLTLELVALGRHLVTLKELLTQKQEAPPSVEVINCRCTLPQAYALSSMEKLTAGVNSKVLCSFLQTKGRALEIEIGLIQRELQASSLFRSYNDAFFGHYSPEFLM